MTLTKKAAAFFAALFKAKTANNIAANAENTEKLQENLQQKEPTIWDKALETHATFKRGWDETAKSAGLPFAELVEVFRSAGGSVYYTYKDPMRIPLERHKALEQAMVLVRSGLDEDYFDKQFIPMLKRVSNLNDAAKMREDIALLIADIETRRKLPPTNRILLRIANFFLVKHNEDPYAYIETSQEEKMEEVANDPRLRAFFLSFALEVALRLLPEDFTESWNIRNGQGFLNYSAQKAMEKAEQTL